MALVPPLLGDSNMFVRINNLFFEKEIKTPYTNALAFKDNRGYIRWVFGEKNPSVQ
jgi:hypothetical protein